MEGEQLEDHVQRCRSIPFSTQDVVTCLSPVKKSLDEPDAQGSCDRHGVKLCLVLDPTCTNITARVRLPSAPVAIKTAGVFDVDWRAYVACDDRVCTLTSGEHKGSAVIRRPHIRWRRPSWYRAGRQKCVYVATADSSIRCFAAKARKQFTCIRPVQCGNHAITTQSKVDVRAGTHHKFRTLGPQARRPY